MALRTQNFRIGLLALITVLPVSSRASKRATVAQLIQTVTQDVDSHKADVEIARQVADIELSERLTEATMTRLATTLKADPQAALQIQLLADRSSFLEPPASELPTLAAPDEASLQRMIEEARSYVAQMLPHLPNFLALRTTNCYDDSPQALKAGAWPVRGGLHRVCTEKRETSLLEERDDESHGRGNAFWRSQMGMISGGEFGSTLNMIMSDTAKGKITWGYWEQKVSGLTAVLHYSVPKSASHYEVIGSVQRQAPSQRIDSPAGAGTGLDAGGSLKLSDTSIVRNRPGYHGSLWLDSTTGAVLQVSIESDAKDSAPFLSAGIVVQYGPVEIGGSRFICPVRSVAVTVAPPNYSNPIGDDSPTRWLNETLFTQYRRFGSTVEILPDTADPKAQGMSH
jgi:hypothetical protein